VPRVSLWLVRAALVHLAVGVTAGALLLAGKATGWTPDTGQLALAHREIVVVGWLVQLAVGVGFWILPPIRGDAVREGPAWRVAGLLNAGVLLYVAGCLWGGAAGGQAGPLLAAGRILELLALTAFGVPLATRAFR